MTNPEMVKKPGPEGVGAKMPKPNIAPPQPMPATAEMTRPSSSGCSVSR